jgi:N-acetylglucosamine kinase-like BadF-type ATPase
MCKGFSCTVLPAKEGSGVSYLAVDIGGTSTRAVVVEADGTCTGYATAGSGNPTASGATAAAAAIASAASGAMAAADVSPADIEAAVAGIAGANGPAGVALREALPAAGLGVELSLMSDVLATYHAGTLAADGYVVVAGTGATAARIRDSRIEATTDGLGWLVGDAGSGFWLGRRVVRDVARALDGRGSPTTLVELLLGEFGIDATPERARDGRLVALQRMIDAVYGSRPVDLARFARLAFDAASDGDETAQRIVADAASELSVTAAAVVSPDVSGPVVLGGSILSQRTVAERVVEAMRRAGCDGPVSTVPDGLVGSAVLALRRAGVTLDRATFDRIGASLATLRTR